MRELITTETYKGHNITVREGYEQLRVRGQLIKNGITRIDLDIDGQSCCLPAEASSLEEVVRAARKMIDRMNA